MLMVYGEVRRKEQGLPRYRAVIWILMTDWLECMVVSFQ